MDSTLDRRIVRTRKLLQDALLKLILKQGYDSIRVQDITEEANLGRATFYVHYKDKKDLLLATIERTRQELSELVKDDPEPGPLPGFRVQFEHAAENRTFYQAILNHVQGRQQMRSVLIKSLQAHLEKIVLTSPIPIEAVANFVIGAALQLLDWWLDNDMPYSIAEMESMFLSLTSQGLPVALGTDQILNPPQQT
ncbi:MAG: TetR/AcrR family transcriptional regulator [Chloroflexi bacterium]|nr:TetR/AcrR family transcriptional regulator [Chloroflexota bacterium]